MELSDSQNLFSRILKSKILEFKIYAPSVFIFLFLLLLAGLLQTQLIHSNQKRELISLPRGIEHFAFGQKNAIADLGWIRAIQDFDYCEQKDLAKNCKGNGWLAQMIDVVTDLAPDFRMAISAGAMALSIVISDIPGAHRIFEKGIQRFPKDWVISYKAAYHFLYEEKNPGRAAELMENAAKNGAPDWVYALAGRLYTSAGRTEFAERLYEELKAAGTLPELVLERLHQRVIEARNSGTSDGSQPPPQNN